MPPTNPGGAQITASQTAFTFPAAGTWTPIAGELCLITVGTRRTSGTADTPTLAGTNGWNVTWTQVQTVTHGGTALARTTVFRGVPSSSTPGTLTVTHSAAHAQCGVEVVSLPSVDQTTNQGVVQSVTGAGSTGGNLAATLAAFGSTSNYTFLGGTARGTPTGFTPEATYTGYSVLGGVLAIAGEWKAASDTTPTGSFTGGASVSWSCVGVEVKLSATTIVSADGSAAITFSSTPAPAAIAGADAAGTLSFASSPGPAAITAAIASSPIVFGVTGDGEAVTAAAVIIAADGSATIVFSSSPAPASILGAQAAGAVTFTPSGSPVILLPAEAAGTVLLTGSAAAALVSGALASSAIVFGALGLAPIIPSAGVHAVVDLGVLQALAIQLEPRVPVTAAVAGLPMLAIITEARLPVLCSLWITSTSDVLAELPAERVGG